MNNAISARWTVVLGDQGKNDDGHQGFPSPLFCPTMRESCVHNRLCVSLVHLLIHPRNTQNLCWDLITSVLPLFYPLP